MPIKLTPGPGDYDNILKHDSAVVKRSHNFVLNKYGGIPKPPGTEDYKQQVIAEAEAARHRAKSDRGMKARGALLMDKGYGARHALNNYEGMKLNESILLKNSITETPGMDTTADDLHVTAPGTAE